MNQFQYYLTRLKERWQKYGLYYFTDHQNWVLDQIAQDLITELRPKGLSVQLGENPWRLSEQIIHFGDRHLLMRHPERPLDPSNFIFITWHHSLSASQLTILRDKLPLMQRIVVSCQITHQDLIKNGIPSEKLVLIPIGIRLARFPFVDSAQTKKNVRQKFGIPDDAFCIGSFQKDGEGWQDGNTPKLIKGADVFLDTLSKVKAKHDKLFVLLTAPARGYIKTGLDQLGIPYRHDILARFENLPPYYAALDAYLIASRLEGGPKALLESFSSGVPVVSTEVGMAADLIEHGKNGLLAASEDSTTLAENILTLIYDPPKRDSLRQQARQDIRAYDWSLVANQYYDKLYQPVLKSLE